MTAPARSVAQDHYATTQSFVDAAAKVAGQMWSEVDPANIVNSWAQQLPELTTVVSGAQLGVANQADSYVAEALETQGLSDEAVAPIQPSAFAGTASDGRGLMTLLANPVVVTLLTISDIVDVGRAMGAGRANLDMLVRTQVADAGRAADQVSLVAHPSATGYVRQTDGNPCARCLILAGRTYEWNRGFQRHPRCGCIHVPTLISHPRWQTMDPRRLYDQMSRAERLRAGFTLADQKALEEGADIFQIVNARHRPGATLTVAGERPRGLRRAQRTTEGTEARSRAALFRVDPETGRFVPRLAEGRPRWTVDEIFRVAGDDRQLAVELLGEFGYLKGITRQPTLRDLQQAAKDLGLRGYSDLTRRQLVERLEQSGVFPPAPRTASALARGVRGGAPGGVAPGTGRAPSVAQLRSRVASHGITVPTGLRKPALVKLVDDLDSGVPAATARERAVASIVDERRGIADALTRAVEVEDLSPRAMVSVAAALRRELSAEQVKTLKPLLEALDAGDSARIRAAIPVVARTAKLRQIGAAGEVSRIPAGQVEWIGPGRSGVVSVVRPGWETTVERRVVLLQRAAAQAATPEQAARLAPVKAAKKAAKAAPAKKATSAKRAPAKKAAPAPPAPSRMTAPALRTELQRAGVDLDLAGVPKPVLAEHVTRLRSGSPAAAETARLRQAVIDRHRAAAETLAEAVEILDIGAEALAVRARARLRRIETQIQGWPQEAPVRALLTAMATGNPATIRRAIATAERRLGLKRVDVSTMDRALMQPVGGTTRDGARVEVVRPGYTVEVGGERVVLAKAVVRELTEADLRRAATPGLVRQADMRRLYRVDDKETELRGRVSVIEQVEDGPRAGWTRVSTSIEHRVRESDGVHWYDAGFLVADISPDGRSVWHSFGIDDEFQGQGFTSRHLARVFEEYQRLGVERILLEANNEVGGYAWARAGFRFADEAARQEFAAWARRYARQSRIRLGDDFIAEVERVASSPTAEPIDFAMIGHDSRRKRPDGISMWPGKEMMLGSTWRGVLEL